MDIPILVVDDEPANLLVTQAVLAQSGIEFVSEASGTQALRCLIEREFALIHTPIIFVTARSGGPSRSVSTQSACRR